MTWSLKYVIPTANDWREGAAGVQGNRRREKVIGASADKGRERGSVLSHEGKGRERE